MVPRLFLLPKIFYTWHACILLNVVQAIVIRGDIYFDFSRSFSLFSIDTCFMLLLYSNVRRLFETFPSFVSNPCLVLLEPLGGEHNYHEQKM